MNCLFCGAKLEDGEKICPKCQKPVKTLISIDDLKFVVVSPSLSPAIEAKKGLFGGGVKKFAQCVADGNAFLAPVFLETTFSYSSDSGSDYECANIMDDTGRPCKNAVHLLSYDCIPAGDVVDGESIDGEKVPAVVLRYQIGKTTNYLILSKEYAENLPANAKEIVGSVRQNLVDRKGPALEGSLADKAGKALGKLFGGSDK